MCCRKSKELNKTASIRMSQRRQHDIFVLFVAVLARVSSAAAPEPTLVEPPHVLESRYDTTSWRPLEMRSFADLLSHAAETEWTTTLVAFLDDTPPCAPADDKETLASFDPISLRHGQRFRPSRYMRTAVATRSQWLDDATRWPTTTTITEIAAASDGDNNNDEGNNNADHQKVSSCATLGMVDYSGAFLEDAVKFESALANKSSAGGRAARSLVQDFVAKTAKVEYSLENHFADRAVEVLWFDVKHEEGVHGDPWRLVASLGAGERTTLTTFISHTFGVRDAATQQMIGKLVCRGKGDAGVIDETLVREALSCPAFPRDHHASTLYEQGMMGRRGVVSQEQQNNNMDDSDNSNSDSDSDDDAAVRFAVRETVFDFAMDKRMALSDVQVSLVPNVTMDGFRLIKAPAEIFGRVKEWYDTATREGGGKKVPESDGGPLYNQREIPTWHTPLPPDLKRDIFDTLKPIFEAWAPTTAPLTGTSAYGVRAYDRGSYLHLHVDTANTHVVSGIVNVDQTNLDAPWPVHIFDHDGVLHAVDMEPGDMLLYESASLLHGRTVPLRGDSYANIFVHYAPEWWEVPI